MPAAAFDYSISYPTGPYDLVQGAALPPLTVGETRTVRVDLVNVLRAAGRTIDPAGLVVRVAPGTALAASVPTPTLGARTLLLTVQALAASDDAQIQLSVGLVPEDRLIWAIEQPIYAVEPPLPNDPVTVDNQPLTLMGQPVAVERLELLAGDLLTGDQSLIYRPAVLAQDGVELLPARLGLLPASALGGNGGGPGQTVGIIAAATISGHRAIMVDGAGLALHADPSNLATYNFTGISTGSAVQGAPVSLVEAGGTVTEPSWSWTAGRAVFVGAGGTLTQVPPITGVLHQVGQAIAPTVLLVQPFPPITRS